MRYYRLVKRKLAPVIMDILFDVVYDVDGNLYKIRVNNKGDYYKLLVSKTVLLEGVKVTMLSPLQYKLFFILSLNALKNNKIHYGSNN